MDLRDPVAIGTALAQRHADSAEPDPVGTLANYAECPRTGDWSMRSALMRYAQPHAARTARVLMLVRRLDAVLRSVAKPLERNTVTCDRSLSVRTLEDPPAEPYPDTRGSDLARLRRTEPDRFPQVLAAYEAATATPLDETERAALPLLGVALLLDELAETLADWASAGPGEPPIDSVDLTCARVQHQLDELGVPVEQGPPPGHRGRRDRGV